MAKVYDLNDYKRDPQPPSKGAHGPAKLYKFPVPYTLPDANCIELWPVSEHYAVTEYTGDRSLDKPGRHAGDGHDTSNTED
jgi:hypothetical protein